MSNQLKCIIIGAGHRSLRYASYAKEHPETMEIVGVADPSELRRRKAAEIYDLNDSQLYQSAEDLASKPKMADFVINGTMDQQHVSTSLPLLERGYDMLLEKPFATTEEDMWKLVEAVKKYGNKVAICHVLRHAPFYAAIRKQLANNIIGDIINIQATEHVSYHHMGTSYIRGKHNRKKLSGSSMLMAKSCHDLDLIAWLKTGIHPGRVCSFGSNIQFRPENAPEGAGTRCIVDCPIEKECLYSARKHYIDHPNRWKFYVWDSIEHIKEPTIEDKIESLKTSPYGRCAWKTGMDLVDHESVLIEFRDGSTATFNMIGGSAKPSRSIHIIGTKGEIQGALEDSKFVIRHIDPRPGHEYSEQEIDLKITGDMTGAQGGHGGGDLRLVGDFLKYLDGKKPSLSTTSLEDSISSHLLGFRAEISREQNKVVEIEPFSL